MDIVALGTNHKYSPIKIREKLSFFKKKAKSGLIELLSCKGIKAGIILSTCNRVELYASAKNMESAEVSLKAFLSGYSQIGLSAIEPHLYVHKGKEAVRHIFQVACGLDSQIIGESHILAQVRSAYDKAKEAEATDSLLDRVFERSFRVSLRVREDTAISSGDISLASIVLNLIKSRFPVLKDKTILIIGVGKISASICECLKEHGLKAIFIANRTYEKAMKLARILEARVLRFERLREELPEVDIIISATSIPHLILNREDLIDIKRQLLVIDLAVPRDVDEQVKYTEGVSLFSLDDLTCLINDSLNQRMKSIPAALEIIGEEVDRLCLESGPAEAPLP